MKEQILKLRKEGKSYNQIQKILGCSKGTISYHCGKGQKEKNRQRTRKRRKDAVVSKTERFICRGNKIRTRDFQRERKSGKFVDGRVYDFTIDDVKNKIGDNPVCYLTGDSINIENPKDYEFDHIVPVSKGGTGNLDNLGITTKDANRAKGDMNLKEFVELCRKVVEKHGE